MKSVRPKKNLGQHFLTDLGVARRIADTVDAAPALPVLEVGPGMGVLTQFLLPKGRPVKVVEIDRESVAYLRERWPELRENILGEDFLRMDLWRVFGGEPFVLTGNYPYDISSQIFFKMLDNRELIPCCTGMVQREMAERIAARPGTKAYGILSVLLHLWYDVELLFTVPPGVFNPPPKVQSAVVRLTRNEVRDCGCDEALLKRIVKGTFQQRRKMLRVSLRPVLSQLAGGRDWSGFLASGGLTRRPEQLAVADFVQLTNDIAAHI
ncbi:MAG: 16S rRNA (adenine(1518)-N(6)/adenine(1519)-N(6))-dimethyltransferase RsmA [Alloprevotella sp.]|nr:16S rRNA (adenine(1518)-N(6)/adenine(1519)-N(6))-dimethyltransferase RsmA [Alloprevotella sp.]